jgi:hypothetical protein
MGQDFICFFPQLGSNVNTIMHVQKLASSANYLCISWGYPMNKYCSYSENG